MPESEAAEFDPLAHSRLRYASVLARVVWRNLLHLLRSPGPPPPARPLRFPNRTPDLWAGWLGHATVLLNLFGSRVLTDPLLTRLGPVQRLVGFPMQPADLPPLDVILVTHAHCDHLSRASLRLLPRTATLVVPPSCADLVADLGFRLIELGWGELAAVGGLSVRAFRPRHWGRRPPLGGRRGYNAYLIERRGWSVLVGGDSAYTEAYEEACRGRRVALALLPIGCYRPALFERAHLTPEQALRVFTEVGADYMLPVHWGTLVISLEAPEEPPRRLMAEAKRLGVEERVRLVPPGGEFTYPGT